MTILVVGDANADLSAALHRFPAEGDDSPIAALAWGGGGSAANVAAALALLGAGSRLLARVGSDPAAEIALRAARSAGVDLAPLQVDSALATGLCFAAVSPGGERTFFSYRGANVALAIGTGQDAPLDGISWLHIAGHALLEGTQRDTTIALLAQAAERNIPISLDLCLPLIHAWRAETIDLLPRLTTLFANELELAALFPDRTPEAAARQLLGSGLTLVVVKLGPRGCLVVAPALGHLEPAFAVAAIDTTGCGDAFVAGFLYAHLRGQPLETCATLGNAAGALSATRYGAAEALPDRSKLCNFLAEHGRPHLAALLADDQRVSEPSVAPDLPPKIAWPADGKEMVLVPAGPFILGAERGHRAQDQPAHEVTLPAFYIDRTPVTVAEYMRFVDATGRKPPRLVFPGRRPLDYQQHPVTGVSWHDARAYAAWAGKRLPSEAEWEKAASWDPIAGIKRRYPWGDHWDSRLCNMLDTGIGHTTPVGVFSPYGDSPCGAIDMAGNVFEWTTSMDWNYPYQLGDGRDALDRYATRVRRGGAYTSSELFMRTTTRQLSPPDGTFIADGFRCVADPPHRATS